MSLVRWVLIGCLLFSQTATAKDMTHRLGVGYKNQFSNDVPSIATEYYLSQTLGLSAALGVDTQKDASRFGFMTRVHKVIFQEDNMNFYMGGGLGVVSSEVNSKTESGFEVGGFAGGEFFFAGLENLGFSFETGIGVVSSGSGVRFRTFGDSPIRAGIMFYF